MKPFRLTCLVLLASTMTLAQTNPVPLINQPLVPTATAPGGAGTYILTVTGKFISGVATLTHASSLAWSCSGPIEENNDPGVVVDLTPLSPESTQSTLEPCRQVHQARLPSSHFRFLI